ncbi:MAG: EAL domain-containing protein [Spirochaetes bacterium]|nr:EAL domain-containing protein [Spirochaetota bacterium]
MIRKIWNNLISCGLDQKNTPFEFFTLVQAITIFSFIAIFILSAHGLLNYNLGNQFIAYFEFFMALSMVINYFLLRLTKNVNITSSIILLFSISLIIFLILKGGLDRTGIVWIFFFPVIAFYLKGKKNGLVWISACILTGLLTIILIQINFLESVYPMVTLRQALLSFITISIFAYFYANKKERTEELLQNQVFIDHLTELPNREKLLQDIKQENIEQVCLINIDNFKEINDFFGHKVGDHIIQELGKKLFDSLKKGPFKIYRLYADEYAVCIKEKMTDQNLKELVIYLHKNLTHSLFNLSGEEITVNISLGIAPKKSKNILENADMALKMAKKKKQNYVFYDTSMQIIQEYENHLKWTKVLKNAIAENRIIPLFQPVFSSKDDRIGKYECLARLLDRNGELISPQYFLEVAKTAKLYTYITRSMISKSFGIFRNKSYDIALNVSADDILNKYTVAYIKKYLKDYQIGPRVIFEIVESEIIENFEEATDFIKKMKSLGARIAIDDFGMGYSNFRNILNLNADYIKLDASLIKNIDTDMNSQIIVESILNFTKKLNIKTIAEHVHSESVYKKVKTYSFDYLQGFFLGKPIQESEI